jgi:hypothetical protein
MKTSYTFLLFLFLINLLCLSAESFGQCELKYTYAVKNAAGVEGGEIAITFEKGKPTPNCLLFSYIENDTPTLILEASKNIDATANKVVFYGLAPGRYLVRANNKSCKALIIGQDEKIIVTTTNVR